MKRPKLLKKGNKGSILDILFVAVTFSMLMIGPSSIVYGSGIEKEFCLLVPTQRALTHCLIKSKESNRSSRKVISF